ncbi:MAG TPA: flagellar protein FlgN [Cellvibrio sp.]|nr:flagellar protein FlgN [Cellvibrio sp.]
MSLNATASHSAGLNPGYLNDMLTQDSHAVTQLKDLLLQERELLEQRRPDGLQAIVARKDQLLEVLTFNAKQRGQLLQAAGLKATLAGWEQLLQRDAITQPLVASWQTLTSEFIECQKANEINGRMINRSKQTLTHLLNLIRGQVAVPSLYTQTGATTNSTSSHSFVKA